MIILTMEINEYEQYGEYFIAVFDKQPTIQQLKKVLPDVADEEIEHIKLTGGRRDSSHEWYHLRKLKIGEALDT
mgnify:CR=1 FL=1